MIVQGGRAYTCARCGETKALTPTNFYFDKARHNVTGFCKPCQRQYLLTRRYANLSPPALERRRAYMRERWRAEHGVTVDQYRGAYKADEAVS